MKNKTNYGEKLTNKLIKKVIRYTIIYTFIFIFAWFFFKMLFSTVTWYQSDILYQILTKIGYDPFYLIFIWFVGFIILVIFCLRKTLNYIDSIVAGTSILIKNDDEKIKLPSDLSEIEDKMNKVKMESKKNYELAKENEKRKNDLIVYLAHDIRTPLTSMIGYLSLLDEIDDMPKKKRKKYINVALDKSFKLEELINELFEITKYNSEMLILEKEEINLTMMLEQIIDDFYPTLNQLNKKIEFNEKEKILINADSDKLARVFSNVIKNAIIYSFPNTNIKLETKVINNYVYINIKNQGKKIAEEKLEKIFEKFYRLDSSRNSKTGGSGLGLAIAKEIVNAHGGQIKATSDEKETCFQIKLPLKN